MVRSMTVMAVAALAVLACSTRAVVAEATTTMSTADVPLRLELDCNASVSAANKDFGFGAQLDMTCATDPTDCFETVCRMCRDRDSPDTMPYRRCNATAIEQPANDVVAQGFKSDIAFEPNQVFKIEFATEAAAAAVTSAECATRVATGDRGVGVSAVFDPSCASGGLGCFGADGCRYCRTTTTPQSATFLSCTELSAATASAGTSTQAACDAAAKTSGMTSVSFVVDALCQTNAVLSGCIAASSCRLCRDDKNEGNQFLSSCKVLRERQQLAATTTATTMASASTTTEPVDSLGYGAACAAAVTAVVVALAATAIRKTRERRVANAQAADDAAGGGAMHRIDSMLHAIGPSRIATL